MFELRMQLHQAASVGNVVMVKALLARAGAKVDNLWKYGCKALYFAVENEHLNVVCVLLAAEISVDEENYAGFTTLHVAANHGRADIVQALLSAGVCKTTAKKLPYI